MAMQNYVKLNKEDLFKVAEIMIMVVEWKHHALSAKSYDAFENNWLPSFMEQLKLNEFKCNRTHSNIFVWIEDQIKHCRRLAPGVDPKNAVHLDDTKIGREVIQICRSAAKGQLFYNDSRRRSEFNNLFQ